MLEARWLRSEYNGCICQARSIECIVVESESKNCRNSTEEQLSRGCEVEDGTAAIVNIQNARMLTVWDNKHEKLTAWAYCQRLYDERT